MWFLISRRLRAYVFLALGAPLLAWLLDRLGQALEGRHGPTRASRVLRWGGRKLRRRSRGPLARRAGNGAPADRPVPAGDPAAQVPEAGPRPADGTRRPDALRSS